MHIDKKTIRKVFLLVAGCILFYWLLHETERFRTLWSAVSSVVAPFVIGSILAFIANVPMRAIESNLKFIRNDDFRRTIAILLTFVAIILVIYGVFRMLVPQISETIMLLIPKVTAFATRTETWIYEFSEQNPEVLEWVFSMTGDINFNLGDLLEKGATMLKDSVTVIATGAFSTFGRIAGALVNTVIGLVFSIYCLARKDILAAQGRKILYSLLSEQTSDEIIRVLRLTNSTFSNFISGQCLEAVILGLLFAVAMAIFGMPYIPLISVLIAVTALVPIVGAFVGCVLGAFFILVNNPLQAVFFVVLFLVIQQIEGNLIYPKVVGTSIGLPGMWVLVAVTVGGEVMGIAGMLIMIPLVSVMYTLMREFTNRRVEERDIDPEKLKAQPPVLKSQFKENRERREQIKFRRRMRELAEKHKAQLKQKKNHE